MPESFNDGVCTISSVTNIAAPGKMPVEQHTNKYIGVRYRERTVGMSRFYLAAQTNVRADKLIRLPLLRDVTTQDVVTTEDGARYRIRQLQYPENIDPPVMDLTLERVVPQ